MSVLFKSPYQLKAKKKFSQVFFLASVSIEQTCWTSKRQIDKWSFLSLVSKFFFPPAISTDARTCTNEFNHIPTVVAPFVCTSCYNRQITTRLWSCGIISCVEKSNVLIKHLVTCSHTQTSSKTKALMHRTHKDSLDPFRCNLVMHCIENKNGRTDHVALRRLTLNFSNVRCILIWSHVLFTVNTELVQISRIHVCSVIWRYREGAQTPCVQKQKSDFCVCRIISFALNLTEKSEQFFENSKSSLTHTPNQKQKVFFKKTKNILLASFALESSI